MTTETHPKLDRQALVEYLAAGCKPVDRWLIGTEHEKFGFRLDTLEPLSHEGPHGIEAMLSGLTRFGWEAIEEGGRIIALRRDQGSITLEPGGQFELSGAPLKTIHETCCEVEGHLREVRSVADEIGVGFLGMGFQPKWRREDIHWMPKGRYQIMRDYMPRVGTLGLDMMTRTCTVQVNLDFSDEADMVNKFRVALALQPVATALFADSPFTDGKPNGFLSYRSQIWTDTDNHRCGMLPFVFEDGFGFERYVDYMLDVPMYFVYRDGRYIDAAGHSFRDFMAGKLAVLPGETPRMDDWVDHLTTAFPEVRLKRFLEMRGADGGPWNRLCALPALWVGLLYDSASQAAAWSLVKDLDMAERERLRAEVPRLGLKTRWRNGTLQDLAREVIGISAEGLRRRARMNANQVDERIYLDPLVEIAQAGVTPAERKLELFHGEWNGSVDPVFKAYAY